MIEGTIYFDYMADQTKQESIAKERARLIQKALAAKSGGAATQRPTGRMPRMWHCEDMTGVYADESHGNHIETSNSKE
jgi:hypothetical protein